MTSRGAPASHTVPSFIATLSAVSGVDKGIRFLSELKVYLAIALMIYIVVFGKTAYLFDAITTNVGDYISKFPSWTVVAWSSAKAKVSMVHEGKFEM